MPVLISPAAREILERYYVNLGMVRHCVRIANREGQSLVTFSVVPSNYRLTFKIHNSGCLLTITPIGV